MEGFRLFRLPFIIFIRSSGDDFELNKNSICKVIIR